MTRGLVRTWWRLFLVQGSWNYERMLGLGAAFAIEPLLRDLPGGPGGPRYRQALARAAQFFNAQPYLAGFAVGAAARAEHEGAAGDRIERLKAALTGPLGSVGDRLVWAGILPVAVGLGLTLTVLVSPGAGLLGLLVPYNLVHLVLRTWALRAGWRGGQEVARALGRPLVQQALRAAGPLPPLVVGFALPVVGAWLTRDLASSARAGVLAVVVVGVVLGRWLMPTLGGLRLGLVLAALAALAGWIWP